ncbi:MAG TPA: WD40 repeat domain-containing protein [Kofleriaceae bacterium]
MRAAASLIAACLAAACGDGSGSGGRPPAPPSGPDTGPAVPQLVTTAGTPNGPDVFGSVRFTPDGRTLLAEDRSLVVFAFDHQMGTLTPRGWFGFEVDRSQPASTDLAVLQPWLESHESIATWAVSPDGRWVVAGGGRSGRMGVWKLTPDKDPPAEKIAILQAPMREVDVVAFARGGTRVIAGGRTPDESSTSAEDTVFVLFTFDPDGSPPLVPVHSMPAGQRFGGMDVSPDGKLALVVGSNRFVRLLEIGEEKLSVALAMESDDTMEDARFTPDGKRVVTVGFDQAVRVWDVARAPYALELRAALRHHQSKTRGLEVAPDGRWMVVSSADHEVTLWPLAGLRSDSIPQPIAFKPHGDEVAYALAIHPTWPWLVTAEREIKVWRINRDAVAAGAGATARVGSAAKALPWSGPPVRLAAWRDAGHLLTVDANGEVALWDAAADPPRRTVVRPGQPQTSDDPPVAGAALAGGSVLLATTGGGLGRVQVDGGTADAVPAHDTAITAVAVGGPCAVTGDASGKARIWQVGSGSLSAGEPLDTGGERVVTVAVAPDGSLAVTSAATGARTSLRAHPLDPTTCRPAGEAVTVFAPPTPFGNVNHTGSSPDGQETPIAFAFSPDGRWALSGGRDGGSATLWKVGGPPRLEKQDFLAGHQYGVFAVAFSPDGTRALTAGTDGATILWRFDPATGKVDKIEDLTPAAGSKSGFPETVAWSPDGARVCVGGGHARAGRLWCYRLGAAR